MSNMTEKRFNGMNGDIVRNATREGIAVGTVPGELYGYKGFALRVTVEFRVERLLRREAYETVTHETVSQPLDFAITTAVWNPQRSDHVAGGATVEPLHELDHFINEWDAESVGRLALLDEWHLNSMQAACAHQTVVWEDAPYRRPSLELTAPCPVTGYRYGSAWLVKPLPSDFLATLDELMAYEIGQKRVYVKP